jgi:hypothetical protein
MGLLYLFIYRLMYKAKYILMAGLARWRTNTLFDPQVQQHSQSQKACTERETNSRLKSATSVPHSEERAIALYSIARTASRTELSVTCYLAVVD